MGGRRIGWLGGSFDPVHEGHLGLARRALEHLDLDEVLFVIAARPPHKPDRVLAPDEERLALVQRALADDPRLLPCDLEFHRDGPSYSYDTAQELKQRLGPAAELYYLIGADTLADLPHWSRIEELSRLVTFCPVARPGSVLDPEVLLDVAGPEGVARVAAHVVPMDEHPASSTAIREALAAGRDPEHLPPGVLELIRSRGLYGAGGASSRLGSKERGTKP